jgi:hypothetical protein
LSVLTSCGRRCLLPAVRVARSIAPFPPCDIACLAYCLPSDLSSTYLHACTHGRTRARARAHAHTHTHTPARAHKTQQETETAAERVDANGIIEPDFACRLLPCGCFTHYMRRHIRVRTHVPAGGEELGVQKEFHCLLSGIHALSRPSVGSRETEKSIQQMLSSSTTHIGLSSIKNFAKPKNSAEPTGCRAQN